MIKHSTISAVIITCNDEQVLEDCLRSVKNWVNEIVAIDMYSTDKTRSILEKYTNNIINHERLTYADPLRTYSFSLVSSEWILMLDPDEIVPEPLANELVMAAQSDQHDVIVIPRQQIMFGVVTSAPGTSDGAHPRFFRKGCLEWPPEVHGSPSLSNLRVLTLHPRGMDYSLLHNSWRDIPQVIDKLMRYSPKDVINLQDQEVSFSVSKLIHTFIHEFFHRFFEGEAYRDGMAGLLTSLYFSFYKMNIMAMLWEKEGKPRSFDQKIQQWGNRWGTLGRRIGNAHSETYHDEIVRYL